MPVKSIHPYISIRLSIFYLFRQDADIDVRRNLYGELNAQGFDDIEHHLGAGRGARVEPVDGAVAGVPGVMVDVDQIELDPDPRRRFGKGRCTP